MHYVSVNSKKEKAWTSMNTNINQNEICEIMNKAKHTIE